MAQNIPWSDHSLEPHTIFALGQGLRTSSQPCTAPHMIQQDVLLPFPTLGPASFPGYAGLWIPCVLTQSCCARQAGPHCQ
jgi:hypothetical protein